MYFCRTMCQWQTLLVDYASTGVGLGMSDVAMHLHHAVLPEDLANGGEEALVKYYWKSLQDLLNQQHPAENYQYSYDEAWRIIDNRSSTTFLFSSLWKTATPESMQLKADSRIPISSIDQCPPWPLSLEWTNI
jgi:hypothetical protein